MAHEIETLFYTGELPWHGLGVHVEDAPSSEEAIRQAGLDWEVDLRPVFTNGTGRGGRPCSIIVPDSRVVVRTSDQSALAVVGARYQPVQNAAGFRFVDAVASGPDGTGDVRYETAGALRGGRIVWMLARMERDRFEVVKGDEIVPYLLLANRHDGTGSLVAKLVNTRVVCKNTLNIASAENGAEFRVRHTGNVTAKVEEARRILGLARTALVAEHAVYDNLVRVKFGKERLGNFTAALYPVDVDASSRVRDNVEERRAEIVRLFDAAPGNDMKQVRGTAWAAVNAVTFMTTHLQVVRGSDGDRDSRERRLQSQWFGTGADLSRRAVSAALAA